MLLLYIPLKNRKTGMANRGITIACVANSKSTYSVNVYIYKMQSIKEFRADKTASVRRKTREGGGSESKEEITDMNFIYT